VINNKQVPENVNKETIVLGEDEMHSYPGIVCEDVNVIIENCQYYGANKYSEYEKEDIGCVKCLLGF
jgi:hypothetical protein